MSESDEHKKATFIFPDAVGEVQLEKEPSFTFINPQLEDLFAQLSVLKEKLKLTEEALMYINKKASRHCKYLTKFILESKLNQDSGQIASNVFDEFVELKTDIITSREEINRIINMVMDGTENELDYEPYKERKSLRQSSIVSETRRSFKMSFTNTGESVTPFRNILKSSIMDERRLCDNLRSVAHIFEQYNSDNKKLINENKLLTGNVMEVMFACLGIALDDFTYYDFGEDNTAAADTVYKVINQFRSELDDTLIIFEPERSLSHENLRISDLSFRQMSLLSILNKDQWREAIDKLQADAEEMTLIDMKLATLKAISKYR